MCLVFFLFFLWENRCRAQSSFNTSQGPPHFISAGQGRNAKAIVPNRRNTSDDKSKKKMESSSASQRLPLSEVVSDCVKRWFKDTLKEAKAGDVNMQVLVSQMYCSGYGIPRDAQKGRIWMTRASRMRSSVWKVSDKHPGYNASDSDSDEMKGDS